MAQTNTVLTQIAVKRLSGKAQTNANSSLGQEPKGSTVQTTATTVFAEALPNNPAQTLYLIQSESVGSPGTAMFAEFEIRAFGDQYANDGQDGETTVNTFHAYELILSTSFDNGISSGDFNTHASTPTAFGTFPFDGGSSMTGSRGRLQIIPEFVSDIPAGVGASNPYIPQLFSTANPDSSPISATDGIDWYLDAFSGILFIQDPVAYGSINSPNTNAAVPFKIKAFAYVGKYQDQATFTANDVGLHISASEGTGFSLGNDATASFESGSAGITVTAGSTNKITIGANTDNVAFNQITGSSLIITQTASISYLETIYETSSIIFSSGSTKFGDTMDDFHDFTGSLFVTGNLTLEDGSIEANQFIASSSTGTNAGFVFRPSDNDLTANRINLTSAENMQFRAAGVFQFDSNVQLLTGKKLQLNDTDNTSRFSISNVSANTGSAEDQNNTRLGIENMGGTEIVSISGSGNVGIGTTTPIDKLQVSGAIRISNNGDTSLILDSLNGSDDNSIIDFRENSVNRALVYWDGSDNDFVISSSLGDFHLLPAGKVGIGTTTPDEKLTVEGNISASGFVSGSDLYVTSTLTALDGGVTINTNDSPELFVGGNITASGDISASGLLFANASDDNGTLGSIAVAMYDTASGRFYYTGSSALGDTTSLALSASAGVHISASEGTGFSIGLMQSASFTSGSGGGLKVTAGATNNIEFELVSVLSSSAQIATDISGAIDAATGSLSASIVGTANEVEVTSTEPGNITIGLPNNVTIAGDLTVNGTTTSINTDQLLVEDPFILLASSSSDPDTDGGIIIQTNDSAQGTALFYDNSSNRWALAESSSVAHNAASATAHQFVVSVSSSTANPSGAPSNFGLSGDSLLGMMYVATTDNDNDTNTIWIYG